MTAISRPPAGLLAVLALGLLCAPARADEPPGGTSALAYPMWWSQPGSVGWRPEAALAGGTAWTFAGLVVGGWELRDPFAPAVLPWPGIAEAQVPLAWYDSAAVVVGEGAAWNGFGSGVSVASGFLDAPDPQKPRAVFTAISGEHGLDQNGIVIAHGNADFTLRTGVLSSRRGSVGGLGVAGDHLWTASATRRLGLHMIDVRFIQRGLGESQAVGVGEGGRGRAGSLGWSWTQAGDSLAARYTRGFDSRRMGAVGIDLDPIATSRDASQRTYEASASRAREGREWGVRIAHDVADVSQWSQFFDGTTEQVRWHTETTWAAARHARPFGEGTLDLTLGYGHDATLAGPHERDVIAPALAWRIEQGRQAVRLFAERIADPVWSDIAPSVRPFLQHTWAGGFAAEAGRGGPVRTSFELVTGRTANRATMFRYPVRTAELRAGLVPDPHRYNFLLTQGSLAAGWRTLAVDASAFALARGRSTVQPRVDPALGARMGAGGGFHVFAGDLGIRLRGEIAYVGVRETDTRFIGEFLLPGYASYAASATVTLGDATVLLRADHLEATRHPMTWLDYSTLEPALDSGREMRAELVWPLFN